MAENTVSEDAVRAFSMAAVVIKDRAQDISELVDPPSTADALGQLAADFEGISNGDAEGFIGHFEPLLHKPKVQWALLVAGLVCGFLVGIVVAIIGCK